MFKIENAQEIPRVKNDKMDEDEEEDADDNEDDEEMRGSDDDEDDELKTGSPKVLLTAIGIGYHNLTKTLI